MQHPLEQIPLWQQLQGAAALLLAVRSGRSVTAELERVAPALRPGVQALGFHGLRWLGLAQALRDQLASRAPPPEADALLCLTLALAAPPEGDAQALPYAAHTLVDQAVEAAKHSDATRHQASFINGCLRRFLRERDALLAGCVSKPQALWNHPQWWIDRVRKDHPDVWQEILRANNQRAPLTLRVNTRQISRTDYLAALNDAGVAAHAVGEHGISLDDSRPVTGLPGYAQGWFSVQDAGAQMAAPLLLEGLTATGERLRLLDACAAPGGKTAHLLEMADADLTALDMDASRCQRVHQNLQRLGLQATVQAADAGAPDAWWDGRLFDGILLDAPCTASGIVRRHPDVRWLRRPTDIPQLAAQQHRLLEALWPLLRPGGRLVYCTCSVFLAEGQGQIETFVTHHTDALLRPSPGHLLPQNSGRAQVFPDNLGGEHDGFYYAVLEKQQA